MENLRAMKGFTQGSGSKFQGMQFFTVHCSGVAGSYEGGLGRL